MDGAVDRVGDESLQGIDEQDSLRNFVVGVVQDLSCQVEVDVALADPSVLKQCHQRIQFRVNYLLLLNTKLCIFYED